jgi:hypothetical protein
MRIDAWTHFIPKPLADEMAEIAGNFADIGKRKLTGARLVK